MPRPILFNSVIDYTIDSLFGQSARTRQAYYSDLLQFKSYLVRFRRHGLVCDDLSLVAELEADLRSAHGRHLDTRRYARHHRQAHTARALLERLDWDLARLEHSDVLGYFTYMDSKQLARATLNRRLAALRKFFKLLVKDGHSVLKPITDRLDDLNVARERKLPIALERDEALDFLGGIEDLRDRAIVTVMLYMGLRISEVVQLNVDDITAHTDSLTFKGKGAKERYVPVHPAVKEIVLAYATNARAAAHEPDELGDPLFTSRLHRRISPGAVRSFIKRYAMRAELLDSRKRRRLSPHKLRHTFATLLLEGDVDIRYIQELLGHEQLATTEIYTSVRKRDLERAISRHPLGDGT